MSGRVISVFAILGVSASGCGGGGTQQTLPPPQVTVAPPLQRQVTPAAEFTGTTRAVLSVEVRARVVGILETMSFVPSDVVEKGQVLFVIEPDPYRAARDEAEASLKSAEAQLAKATADLSRMEEAVRSDAVSQQDLDSAVAQYQAARGNLQAAQARLEQAQIEPA